jgi:uncharacterized membrane protein YobD (UPF0266 family)
MAEKSMMGKLAVWAFLIGIVIALVFGIWHAYTMETNDPTDLLFAPTNDTGGAIAWVLVILGAVVGILAFLGRGTITSREIPAFLLAGIALLVMYGTFQAINYSVGTYIGSLLTGVSLSLALFIAPAVGILAIKAIWDIGKEV